jgi:hypothetical protein
MPTGDWIGTGGADLNGDGSTDLMLINRGAGGRGHIWLVY